MVVEDESTDIILRELIEAVDLDTSIFINENELAAVCDLDPRDLKEIFEQLDLDKDGKISVEEFILNYKKFQSVAKEKGTDTKPAADDAGDETTANGHDKFTNGNGDAKQHGNGDAKTHRTPTRKKSNGRSPTENGEAKTTPSKKKKEKKSVDIRKTAEFYLGQEYLDDLYEIARSRNDPMLLESLESFLAATVEGLLQKQSDNEKLDTALKRATEKNSAIALELEAEMEHQVAMLEEKIREEEQRKLEEQKQEAQTHMERAQRELKDMEQKVKDLEETIEEKKSEANIPDVIIEEIQNKERENKILQKKLVEFQTQMALMRTEVAQMKAVYDEQAERLASERGAVLTCVSEQENLTRQLHLLHEANKRLHDTNDDLRSALDTKRSSSSFAEESSFQYPRNSFMHNSFRSDPGARRSVNGSVSNNDTDEDSKTSIPYDDDEVNNTKHSVNETPLLAELMAVDKSYALDSPMPMPLKGGAHSPANSTLMEPVSNIDKETFIKQLEILCETNKRLGESNDELRDALGLLSGQIRMDQEMMRSSSSTGCQSAPITPMRTKAPDSERPQSTSSPRRVLLTKSGYHTTSSLPDISADTPKGNEDNTSNQYNKNIEEDTNSTVHRHREHIVNRCSDDQSKSASPSDSTLLSSSPTGQMSNASTNPGGGPRKHPPAECVPRPVTPTPGTSKLPPVPDKKPERHPAHTRTRSDESQNSNERTCDCGNEIYGSDISICDFCLDSITSAVDELTTDYASSLSDDDGSTIYTGKDDDADLYNVTGDGIFPIPRLDDSKDGSSKLDKSIQCTDYGFNESDITELRSVKSKCFRLDCNEIDCKCQSTDDILQRKSSHNSSLKSVNWEDLKEEKSDSCSGRSGSGLPTGKSGSGSDTRKPSSGSGTSKLGAGSRSGKSGTGSDTRKSSDSGSPNNLSASFQSRSKSDSTGDTVVRSVLSDNELPTKKGGTANKSSNNLGSGSGTPKSDSSSTNLSSQSRKKSGSTDTGDIMKMQDTELFSKDGGAANKSSDEPKIILRISLSEQDLRNIGVNDSNELNLDVLPAQVAVERVTSTSPSHDGRRDKLPPSDVSRTKKHPEHVSVTENSSYNLGTPFDADLLQQTVGPGPKDNLQISSMLETTPSSSDTDGTKPTKLKLKLPRIPPSLSETDSMNIMPPNVCEHCRHEIRLNTSGVAICLCNNNHNDVNRVSYRQLAESTILTDSDDDSNDYSDQEATQSVIRKRITPVGNQTQDATYETSDRHDDVTTEHSDWISDGYSSHTILQGIEAELSMYARRQPDELVDEDDMDDEELVRLVDQTNEDDVSVSLTEDPIYIEEKLMREPIESRGHAVGADTSDDSMSDRATPDRMYKLVLAGNAAVGKSSFIIRLCRNKFYSALNSTLGVDFQMKTINCDGSKVALQLWDTAGQERFRSIAKSYFRRVDGVVLLYDVTCENSFCDVREWLESIQSSNSKEVPVIICGNKTDLRPEAIRNGMPVVSRQQGLKLAQDVNALFIETSAKDGTNIQKACVELTRKLQKIDDDHMAEITINLEEKQKPKSRCCR